MTFTLEPIDYDPFAEDSIPEENPKYTLEVVDYDPFAEPEQRPEGFWGALSGGFENTGRNLKSAFNVFVNADDAGVLKTARRSAEDPNNTEEMEQFKSQLAQYGEPDGVWEAIKNVGRAAWEHPLGATHEMVAQLPNSGAVMGSAGAGAAVGSLVGGPVGAFVGGLGGLFLGNTAIETGANANEKAMGGNYDRGEVMEGGVVKGGVITGVDALTLGLTKWLTGSAGRAATKAVQNTLIKNGIDIADDAAVKLAMQDARIIREATRAGEAAAAAATKGVQPMAREAMSFAGEVAGEGVGEYAGSYFAPGMDPNLTDAVMESIMSMPQSAGEVCIGKSLNLLNKKPIDSKATFDSEESAQPTDIAVQDLYAENQRQMENMESVPNFTMKGNKDLLAKNVDDFRRQKSIEQSEAGWDRRRQAMMSPDQPAFQRGLADRPDESNIAYSDGGSYHPFADIWNQSKATPQGRVDNAVAGFEDRAGRVMGGDPVLIDQPAMGQQNTPIIQSQAQDGAVLTDDFRPQQGQLDPFEKTRQRLEDSHQEGMLPVFEHEVEPDKINTNPSEAQKEAGNYKKDHIRIDGHQITIENPDGSTRSGTGTDGKKWESTMHGHYGYFKRTMGKDGDQVDVVVKPGTETSPKVFVVDQVDPATGRFDEHKVIMGADSAEEAKALYLSNYEDGWQGFGEITEMNQDDFKAWVKDGTRTKKPLAVSPHGSKPATKLSYEEFKAEYQRLFDEWNKWTPDQVGSQIYSEKLGKLEDEHPEFTKRFEEDIENPATVKENLTVEEPKPDVSETDFGNIQPGAAVTWTTKKGEIQTGEVVKKGKKGGSIWHVRKPDGKVTFVNEKDLSLEVRGEQSDKNEPQAELPLSGEGQVMETTPEPNRPGTAEDAISKRISLIADQLERVGTNDGQRDIDAKWLPGAIKRSLEGLMKGSLSGKQYGKLATAKVALSKAQSIEEIRGIAHRLSESVKQQSNKNEPKDITATIADILKKDGFKNITDARKKVAEAMGTDAIKPGTTEAKEFDKAIEAAKPVEETQVNPDKVKTASVKDMITPPTHEPSAAQGGAPQIQETADELSALSFRELAKKVDELQDIIDKKHDELDSQGISLEDQENNTELSNLYNQRIKYDSAAALKGYEGAKKIIRDELGIAESKSIYASIDSILRDHYGLNSNMNVGSYMMSKYTAKALNSPKETIINVAKDISKILLSEDSPGVDYYGAMESNLSGLTDIGKREYIEKSLEKAEKIHERLISFFLETPKKIHPKAETSTTITSNKASKHLLLDNKKQSISDVNDSLTTEPRSPTVKENLTVAPGQAVTWQDKKGNTLSGELIRPQKKGGQLWQVRKAGGKNTFVHEKNFKLNDSESTVVSGSQTPKNASTLDETEVNPVEKITGEKAAQDGTQYSTSVDFTDSTSRNTDTPAFRKWFGNSKVVDENGDPVVVYHGTNVNFNAFKPSEKTGTHGETDQIEGIYFTDNKDGANWYALVEDDDRFLKRAYVSIKNPYHATDIKSLKNGLGVETLGDVADKVKSLGHDGLIIEKGFYSNGGPHRKIIAFDPTQIKSIYNAGTWDGSNPDIRYSISSINPWPENFPNVVVHTAANKVAPNQKGQGGHPDHKAAKAGDVDAANRLVFDLVKPEKVLELKKQFPDAMVVPVHAEEEAGKNKIPRALARAYGEIAGFKVDLGIVQTNKSGHTKKDAAERIISRAEFDGDVNPGQEYIILDDIITTGETLSELRHYIENNGGKVVAASTLGYSKYSTVLAVKQDSLKKIQDKFNVKELEDVLKEFNIAGNIQALTNSEAKYILSFRAVDAFRNRILEAGRNRSGQSKFSVFQGEVRRFQEETWDSSSQRINTLPGQGLTTQDIQKHFKGQKAFLSPDGKVSIKFKNGHGCTVETVKKISDKDYEFAMRTGRMGKDGIILGKYSNQTIQLSRDYASDFTLDHEIEHLLEDLGIITPAEIMALNGKARQANRSGQWEAWGLKWSDNMAENRANFLAQALTDRGQHRNTWLDRVIQKIVDFLDGLLYVASEGVRVRKLARDVESGKVFGRQSDKAGDSIPIINLDKDLSKGVVKSGTQNGTPVPRFAKIGLRETGELRVPRRTVRNVSDAAQMLSGLSDAAQEEVYLITADRTGRVLEVHKFSKGTSGKSDAHINQMAGHLLKNEEAHTTYLIHNHISGDLTPSNEDLQIMRDLRLGLRLAGIKVSGLIISDGHYAQFDEFNVGGSQKIKQLPAKSTLPVSERRVISRELQNPLSIKDANAAMERFEGEQDGILLMDEGRREVAFIPFKKGVSIREAARDILAQASDVNAVQAVINMQTFTGTNRGKLYQHLAEGLATQNIDVNDIITKNPFGRLTSMFETNQLPAPDINGMRALDSDETLYQTSDDIFEPKENEKNKAFGQIAAGIKNVITNRKNKGPGYKEDIGVIENVLGLMSHYSENIPALKRTFDELLKRPEWKFQKENELSKNGEESMIGTIGDLQKHNKAAYAELKKYLVNRDINQIGSVLIQEEDGTWTIWSPKDDLTGKRHVLEEGIPTKKKARDLVIQYEIDEYHDPKGRDALRAFRAMTANLHDFYAESWEMIIKEYEDRGLTLPQVVTRTKAGEVRIDLKVALAQMGDRSSYYFPRQRSNGDWRVYASKKGEHDFIEYRDFKTTADFLAGKMKAKGYDVEVKKVGSMSEDVYQNVKNILSTQAMVNQALAETKMDAKSRTLGDLGLNGEWRGDDYFIPQGGVYEWSSSVLKNLGGREYSDKGKRGNSWSPGYWFEKAPKNIEEIVTNALYAARGQETDISFEIAQSLANQLADTLRARGSRARMISRSDAVGKDVPIGYETDPLKAIAQAVNSAAGGYAKQQVALNTSKAITGQHYTWDEWQKQHKDYDALMAAEDELAALQKNSETEEERIAEIDREIKELQRERTGVKTESEKARQDRLFRIGILFREKEKIRKWKDDNQAAEAHQKIARLRADIHREYREYIQANMLDPERQKRAYTDAVNAVENVLKNDEAGDRVINTLKGLASVWFLGGRLSSAAINLTAMGTTVPAAMDAYGGIPLMRTVQHIVKAGKTYASFVTGKGKVSKEDRAILEDIFSRGWVAAQLNMETVNALKSGPAQKYGRAVELLMTPFKITEEFNRGTTILAAYKGIVAENPGMNKEEALMKAKKVSDRAHGIYGVENQPALLRKGRGLRAASAMYIFQTFMHNYFTTLSYMIGRKQAGAATYMILSPMVFGGAASSILLPAIKMIFKAMDEDDPEEKIYQIAEELFGEAGGDISRYGLPGLAGISLKGSLAPNMPDFEEPLDALGPIGGMMRNIYDGAVNITHGDYLKGIEKISPLAMGNVAKAYREVSQGVTTRAGDPVFFGNEQIKGDLGTGIMRAAGLNPTKIAKPREVQWNETLKRKVYAERKQRLYSRIIRYHAQPVSKKDPAEWQDIIMDIKNFNARVRINGLNEIVPMITAKTIKNRLRRAFRPSKRERARI